MTQAVTLSGLGSTNALYTDSSGNVGIGTSSPAYKLNVSKNGSGGDLAQLARFTDTNTANSIGPLHLTIGAANHYAVSPSPVLCGTNGIALGVGDGSDLANQRRLTIDASGNVGIGTSSPATYGKLVVKQTADTSISSLALVAQASTTDSQLGIGYDAASGTFRLTSSYLTTGSFKPISFWTSDAERMRIDSSGNVTLQKNISVGAAAPTTSGAGISFPATQSASTDANTLDDYEEGTFTPTITAASGSYTSVTNISGIYTKIGNCVSVAVSFQISNLGTGIGNAQINGMPFSGIANRYAGPAREIAVNGSTGSVYFNSNTTLLLSSVIGTASTASAYWLANITYQLV